MCGLLLCVWLVCLCVDAVVFNVCFVCDVVFDVAWLIDSLLFVFVCACVIHAFVCCV